MMPTIVLSAMYEPLLIGLPDRIALNNSSCSIWYGLAPGAEYVRGPEYRQLVSPSMRVPVTDARPFVPNRTLEFSS